MIDASMSGKLPSLKGRILAKKRTLFTRYHLIAAEFAANKAQDIEAQYKPNKPPQAEIDLYLSQVSTAIICSVAALESNINEYIMDNYKALDDPCFIPPLTLLKKYPIKQNDTLQKLFSLPTVLLKYDIVSHLLKNCLFTTTNHNVIQRVAYFIDLRNYLVHFIPEWDNELDHHLTLTNNKKNHCPANPFYNEDSYFPHFLSATCASRCCKASIDFVDLFKSHIG